MNRFRLGWIVGTFASIAACGSHQEKSNTGGPIQSSPPAPAGEESAVRAEPGLEVFSFWTGPGDVDGFNALLATFEARHPGVEVTNGIASVGEGRNPREVLSGRLAEGNPPDVFQLHGGMKILLYSPDEMLQPLDEIYAAQGLDKVLPKDLLSLLSYNGHYWCVPVNIHRGNVLWYNKQLFADNGLIPPRTFDEFFAVAEAFKKKRIVPYAFGSKGGWEDHIAFESVLLGALGAEGYRGLWIGATPWTDKRVTRALQLYKKMRAYANKDHGSFSWDGAAQLIADGKAAMFIHADWANGYFIAKGFTGYGWIAAPGTSGTFSVVADAFALPRASKAPINAKAWLELVGSKEGQETFNPKKGSICARTDCDPSLFNDYLKSSAADFASHTIVPGTDAAAPPKWVASAYRPLITEFVAKGDVAATQAALQKTCVASGICK